MALPATIYRVSIDLSDVDKNRYIALATTVARHPSETAERLIARLIAYALSYDEDIAFTRGISEGEEPDLWIKSLDGRLLSWIEVGLPEAKRLVKAGNHCEQVTLFAYGAAFERWLAGCKTQLAAMKNFRLIYLSDELIDPLVAQLDRSVNWQFTNSDNTLYITVGDVSVVADLVEINLN